jgi:glycosyltransferase involved in cell wall biosynthesis
MTWHRPWVSVIMPVYNQADYLSYSLESIFRQKIDSVEVILVDDGSADAPDLIAGQFPQVRFYKQANRGYPAAMNFAFSQAEGSYITFLDADDWWADDKLTVQLGLLESRPDVEIAVGTVLPVRYPADDPSGSTVEPVSDPHPLLNLGSALMRRAAFEKVGLFDVDLKIYADWDWFLRARDLQIPMLTHDDIVLYYRRHDRNMTNDRAVLERQLLKLFKKTLDRRRSTGPASTDPTNLRDLFAEIRKGSPRSGV